MTSPTEAIAAHFATRGCACRVEAASRGIIIYAAAAESAQAVAQSIARDLRSARVPAYVLGPEQDADDGAWWAAVDFNWDRV